MVNHLFDGDFCSLTPITYLRMRTNHCFYIFLYKYSDEDLWTTLGRCHMRQAVRELGTHFFLIRKNISILKLY
jgi:hypothetical protein